METIQCGPSMTFWKIDIIFATKISICQKGYLSPKTSLTVRTVLRSKFFAKNVTVVQVEIKKKVKINSFLNQCFLTL